MPALSFVKELVQKVESGQKVSTIRAERKDGRAPCKLGDELSLYTGMRTKSCRLLKKVIVNSMARVRIHEEGVTVLLPAGWRNEVYSEAGLETLAYEEGFDSWANMRDWFDVTHGLPFEGTYVYWGAGK